MREYNHFKEDAYHIVCWSKDGRHTPSSSTDQVLLNVRDMKYYDFKDWSEAP